MGEHRFKGLSKGPAYRDSQAKEVKNAAVSVTVVPHDHMLRRTGKGKQCVFVPAWRHGI